jgi:hypothetical protein
VATNPVEVISAAKTRLATVAAIRAGVFFVLPAIVAGALGAVTPQIATLARDLLGYLLAPPHIFAIRVSLFALSGLALLAAIVRAALAYRNSEDFVATAEQVDRRVNAHQQVVTLATLAAPGISADEKVRRSPLFPVLWRNVMNALAAFDPRQAFAIQIGRPLRNSSLAASALIVALALAMLALATPPSPLQRTAIELQKLADKIDQTATTPEEHKLAKAVRKVAEDLLKPDVPDKQKEQEIQQAIAMATKADQMKSASGAMKGSGSGSGEGNAAAGSGNSPNAKGMSGTGPGQGNKQKTKNGSSDSIQLKNELAKAEAQVETNDTAATSPGSKSPKNSSAPAPGPNPNEQGGSAKNPNQKGNAPMPVPQPDQLAGKKQQTAGGKQFSKGGTSGDTHLGEMPAPTRTERFYKPGEKGAPLEDARYVVFRIPPASSTGGDGKMVTDTDRTKAATPYSNAVLAASSDNAPPDERQIVPPRYRDLIR